MLSAPEAVANNTILANFASVDRLDILRAVLGRLYIPMPVYMEVTAGIAAGHMAQVKTQEAILATDEKQWLMCVELTPAELRAYGGWSKTLGRGEAACLAVAESRGWIILTDDRQARTLALKRNLRLSGTLGVLKSAVRSENITVEKADSILAAMIERGYHSPFATIREIMSHPDN